MIFSIVCEIVFITLLAVSQSQTIKLELKGDLFAQPGGGGLTYSWDVSKQPKVTDANCEISKGEQPAGIILKTEFKLTNPKNWKFPDYTFVINWAEDSAKAPQITWNNLSPERTLAFNSNLGTVEWIFIDGKLHHTEMALTYIGKKGGNNRLPNKLPVKKCKKKPTPKTTPTTSNSLNKLIDILLQQYAKQYTTTPYMGGYPYGTPYVGGYPYTLRGGTSAVGLLSRGAVGLPSRGGYPYTLRGGTSTVGLPSRGGYPYTLRGGTSAVGLSSRGGYPYTLRGGTSAVGLTSRGGNII